MEFNLKLWLCRLKTMFLVSPEVQNQPCNFFFCFRHIFAHVLCNAGGATSLSRHEVDEVRAEADAEFGGLVRESNNNRRKKTLQKKNHPAEDDTGSLFGDGISGKLPRFANKITSKV